MHKIDSVLFDLDGTLLDTAPDMVHALNIIRQEYGMPELELHHIRPYVGHGAKMLLKLGFGVDEASHDYSILLEKLLSAYDDCLTRSTILFPQMSAVLDHLEAKNIPWGIVTNKPARFTLNTLHALDLSRRSGCIICGDTLTNRKPHPEPILHACNILQRSPATTLYIGDAATDVIASKAAGTKSLVALYGYIGAEDDPYDWKADGYIKNPAEIIDWL
jgi:phosphoglycolate phosphatase